jgi:DNA-directed RNA polymerase subunit beta'
VEKNTAVRILLASPEEIRSWSHGEVRKSETISYRNFKPEPDGLFCEKIFGPVRDYECRCGKFKGARYKGVICDRCGVEVTINKVRRERFGHIELASPVVHTWYLKTIHYIALLLNVTSKVLTKIAYFINFVVIDPMDAPLKKMQLLTDEEYREYKKQYDFVAKKGAEAIIDILSDIDLVALETELMAVLQETSKQKKAKAIKRLKVIKAFKDTNRSPINMILDVIPVIPPDLRPLLQLDGGRFATADLNDLYQRVINRNTRLKKLMEVKAPDIMIQNEKRMLQESVDALFDNSKRDRPILGTANRPLKSLSDTLKGKEGRFRQNLLGKRVDYSGRSVIVVNPRLEMDQCGIPKEMALELFKPFVMEGLVRTGLTQSLRQARAMVEQRNPDVYKVLSEVVKGHPVLLNRAPTLHRLGIEAFDPILCEGKAIQIPPLVCQPFNADFDGDQMAVHIPLTLSAQMESRVLMLSSRSILSPASGNPVMMPQEDIILGCYYLTMSAVGEPTKHVYNDFHVINNAYNHGYLKLRDAINYRIPMGESYREKGKLFTVNGKNGKTIITSVGQALYNGIIREEIEPAVAHRGDIYKQANDDSFTGEWNLPYYNEGMSRGNLRSQILECYRLNGSAVTAILLDKIKETGFEWATTGGISVGIANLIIPPARDRIIADTEKKVDTVFNHYEQGLISDNERYQEVVRLWREATEVIKNEVFDYFHEDDPIHMMASSGARGSRDQINQLCGLKGLMTDPTNKIIEFPIKSNFKEGLNVLEYFISTSGTRKGLADTALRTSDAGYLTRRLVDVSHDVIIREVDCTRSTVRPIIVAGKTIKPISIQAVGKKAHEDVKDPLTGEIIVKANRKITFKKAKAMDAAGVKAAVVEDSVNGIILTPLYDGSAIVEKLSERIIGRTASEDIKVWPFKIHPVDSKKIVGNTLAQDIMNLDEVVYEAGSKISELTLKNAKDLGYDEIKVATGKGKIVVPYNEIIDEKAIEKIVESSIGHCKVRSPMTCKSTMGVCAKCYGRDLSTRNLVDIGEAVGIVAAQSIGEPGTQLTLKTFHMGGAATVDITSGLPRVEELFEARKPKGEAPIAAISGTISIEQEYDLVMLTITSKDDAKKTYKLSHTIRLLVANGDEVEAGQSLADGPVDPHELLRIRGMSETQKYLITSIQKVYKSQGVDINDKHIEIIIHQLLRRVQINDPGDSNLIPREIHDKLEIQEINRLLESQNKKPVTFEPVLQRVTKSAITSDSFLSAASFQETPRVLSRAAAEGKIDPIHGLKEAVIVGQLIPSGTGIEDYLGYEVISNAEEDEDDEGIIIDKEVIIA